jgi:hypothetical protein
LWAKISARGKFFEKINPEFLDSAGLAMPSFLTDSAGFLPVCLLSPSSPDRKRRSLDTQRFSLNTLGWHLKEMAHQVLEGISRK